MSQTTDLIRNVSLAGHGGAGKTTLFERLLFAGGVIPRAETVESGKTVSDSSAEEIEHKISIHAALAHIERDGRKINLFDTPGSPDFVGDVILTFRSAEFAVLVLDGRSGVQIETVKLWRNLDTRGKPRGVFVGKLDDAHADFAKSLADVKEKFKIDPVVMTVPMGDGADFKGVIDILALKAYFAQGDSVEKEGPIPDEYSGQAAAARERLVEAAAEGSDGLMERYLERGTLEDGELREGLILALAKNRYVPAFAGAALRNSGLLPFLDFAAAIAPDPRTAKDLSTDGEVPLDPDKPLAALVIKTSYDQFSGKISWVKIIQGKLTHDCETFNTVENKKEHIGKIYTCQGRKLQDVGVLHTGDVGVIVKGASLRTNDTLSAGDTSLRFVPLRLPSPVHSVAVRAVAKKDDDKLGDFLMRAAEEDRTFNCAFNAETKETVISGMGEVHVHMILDKIKQHQKIEVETHIPHVPYRETITKKAEAEYTHKKQTGGHGQYGKVVLEIAPLPPGAQYKFVNAVFGGAVSKGYIPGVEKGIHEAMAAGTMAGYPVVDVEAKLLDGKEHPVDSSELAFKLAARNAFREAMRHAGPTLLEPVMHLTVFVETKYLGDVMSDLSGKRGKIQGEHSLGGGIEEIQAQVPQSELMRYSIDLRSITSGTGSFSVEFDHYAPISGKISDEVVKAAQAFRVHESEE